MRIFITVFLISVSFLSFSQKRFSTFVGLGIGVVMEDKFPTCNKNDKIRGELAISQFMNLNHNYSIGIELMTSGPLFRYLIFGDGDPCEGYDAVTNTRTLSYNNLNASSYFLRTQYSFSTENDLKPFMNVGFGLVNYYYNNITTDTERIAQSNFAISPEVGVQKGRFRISGKLILGGKTPSFEGYDSFSDSNKTLSSITPNSYI